MHGFGYRLESVRSVVIFNSEKRKTTVKYKPFILIPLTLLTLTALPAWAEGMGANMQMDSKTATQTHQGKGTVNSVDAKAGKVNLSHEPIQSLDWPGMRMDFDVQDKAALTKLKPGQKVAFKLIETRKGKYVISEVTVLK